MKETKNRQQMEKQTHQNRQNEMNKSTMFQIGLCICCFLYVGFSLIYKGQVFLDLLYYTLMPLSFLLMCIGYPFQSGFTRAMRNVLIVVVIYNLGKLFGVVGYDTVGIKIYAPLTFVISNVYYYY